MYLTLLQISFSMIVKIPAYQIDYVDCTTPNIIKKYDARTVCEKPIDQTKTRQEFTLLQRRNILQIDGWSCAMSATRLYAKCGAWSHLKLSAMPTIDIFEEISEQLCDQMITNRKFRPYLSHTDYPLTLSRTNVISLSEIGNLHEERDSVRCTGETVHIGNSLHTNTVQLVEYKITLQPEKLTVKGSTVEVDSAHIKLPCDFERRGCVTGRATYIWSIEKPDCALERIKVFNPTRVMDTFLYDYDKKILINTTGNTKIPGCRDIELETTTYDNLYVSRSAQAKVLPEVANRDVDIVSDYKLSDDYLEFSVERRLSESAEFQSTAWCHQQMRGTNGENPVPLEDGNYGLVRGNLLYVFVCKNSTGKILEMENCFEDIPIEGKPQKFVDATTGILKAHSPVTICDRRFPLTVRTTTGWVTVNPHIQPTAQPERGRPEMPKEIQHEDLHKGGLYTSAQRAAWEALVNFPNYHQALLKGLSWGNCKHSSDCSSDKESMGSLTNYDLARLIPEVSELNWWQDLKDWVTNWGAWLSFAVILITLTKVLINLTIVSVTLIKEGPSALLALLSLICCQSRHSYKKIKRRNQRLKSEEDIEMTKP